MLSYFQNVSEDQINNLFPFYFVLNDELKLKSYGKGLRKIIGEKEGESFNDVFEFVRPALSVSSINDLKKYERQLLILSTRNNGFIKLRGEIVFPSDNRMIFFGSVWVNGLSELTSSGLAISDFPLYDPLVELLQMIKGQQIITTDVKALMVRLQDQKAQLEKREKKYKDLLANLYDGVINFDENGNIIECNKALCAMTGYSERELLQMKAMEITYHEDWPIAKQARLVLIEKGFISSMYLRCIRKDGRMIDIEVSSTAVFENGVYKGSRDIVRDVTERKIFEEQLRDLSLVAEEASNVVVICNINKKIEWVNKSFVNVTGYTLEEVRGLNPGHFLQGEGTDQNEVLRIRNALQNGEQYFGQILNYTKGGFPYWTELEIKPVKDSSGNVLKYISIGSDITDRLRKNEELRQSELKWKFALEGTGDGIWEYSSKQNMYIFSENLKKLLRNESLPDFYSGEELLSLIHPEDHEIAKAAFYSFLKNETEFLKHEYRIKTGEDYIWIMSRGRATQRDEKGYVLHALGIATDITASKKNELEISKARIEAERASEYKNQFLSTMSHEIRTPLNAIIGLTDIMMKSVRRGEMKENISSLSFSANHLLSLINDILDLSKIESGKIEFIKSSFNIVEIIKAIYNSFQPLCIQKELDFTLDISEDLPSLLIGDELRLTQIVNNIVNNAIKFTDKGKVAIKISSSRISANDVRVEIAIADTGIGIKKANQKKIFDDFVQVDATIVQKFGGTGLGLAITKKLIELQGGKMKVESKVNKGSIFTVQIPYQIASEEQIAINKKERGPASGLSNMKVLLVEDIAVNRKVATAYLESWNISVSTANDGVKCLEMFRKNNYDLVLIDLYMPKMNGFTAISKIRRMAKGNTIPIVALTASAETSTINKALEAGADACISKPINQKTLYNTLRKFAPEISGKINYESNQKSKTTKSLKLKYINLKMLNDASLGNQKFVEEMLNVLAQEIPSALNEASGFFTKKDFKNFSATIHRLKNSMLMLGMVKIKDQLEYLEKSNGKNQSKAEKYFDELKSYWQNSHLELKKYFKLN